MTVTSDYSQFDPHAYLLEYYADVGPENQALLDFMVRTFRLVPQGGRLLDFGGGPTVYACFAAAPKMREIHLSDYFGANLDEIQKWLGGDAGAFDWGLFSAATLEKEGIGASKEAAIQREALAKARITRLYRCDAKQPHPIDGVGQDYEVVMTNFCAEAAACDHAEWEMCMANIASFLKPGGRMILSAVKGAQSYGVGETSFLAVPLYEDDLRQMLISLGFLPDSIMVASVPADRSDRHYQGLMFATAVMR